MSEALRDPKDSYAIIRGTVKLVEGPLVVVKVNTGDFVTIRWMNEILPNCGDDVLVRCELPKMSEAFELGRVIASDTPSAHSPTP